MAEITNPSEFQGFFAEFYDILHQHCQDSSIYPILLKPYGKEILELGSGTGRIAIPLAQAGFFVTGIESEPDMIRLMKSKDYPKDHLRLVQGDARQFDLGQTFDAILLSCNFINHFLDATDILAILKCCYGHLKPQGILIIDCSVPDTAYMAHTNGQEEVFEFRTAQGTLIKDTFTATYDLLNQLEHDHILLEEYCGNKLLRRAETRETLSWYYPREIRSLIREAGLVLKKEVGELTTNPVAGGITAQASGMVFYCGLA